jgi:DNA repair protein RadC
MQQHFAELSQQAQGIAEAGLIMGESFSVGERLARYGSSALSGVEHLRLLVGRDSGADSLLRHFGSLGALRRASFRELRQFLTKREAEAVVAGLGMSSVVDAEEALAGRLDRAEAVYRANLEMQYLRQEVVRVLLLDAQNRCITMENVCKGTVDRLPAYPREIFRPVIVHGAAGFVVVHNHPSGGVRPSPADIRLTERLVKGARILGVRLLDHVIVGRRIGKEAGYFSFQEAGLLLPEANARDLENLDVA